MISNHAGVLINSAINYFSKNFNFPAYLTNYLNEFGYIENYYLKHFVMKYVLT